jgi:hypothetical protein
VNVSGIVGAGSSPLGKLLETLEGLMGQRDEYIQDLRYKHAHETERDQRMSHLSLPSSMISMMTAAYTATEKIERNIYKYQAALNSRFGKLIKRSICIYQRVYVHTDPSQPSVQVWRPIIEGVLTEQWHLSSFSQPLVKHKYATLVRSLHAFPMEISKLTADHGSHSSSSTPFVSMLEFLGYRFDYEFVKIGYVFPLYDRSALSDRSTDKPPPEETDIPRRERRKDEERRVEVTVYSLLRLERRHDLTSTEPIRGMKWVVEISGYGEEDQLPRVQERVLNISRMLAPLTKFSKLPP